MTDQQIKSAIRDERKAIEQWDKLAQEKVAYHKRNIRDLQKLCSHKEETYYPDPSGNNDSTYTCNVCGRDR